MANCFGHSLSITSFGESHGPSTGVIIDGYLPGIRIDFEFIQAELNRRRPGQSHLTSSRDESDEFTIESGVFEGKSTGAPICIRIPNKSHNPADYEALKDVYRPGHADFVYDKKYGHRDYLGGGRSSARVTAGWVAAGALAKLLLKPYGISVQSVVSAIHNVSVNHIFEMDWSRAEENAVRCPDTEKAVEMSYTIEQAAKEGDSLGGIISTRVENCPVGLGEPLFDKLNADLAKAVFSINAVKGLEFGAGFAGVGRKGSEFNDTVTNKGNRQGGITGGISNGQAIEFSVAFKPTSSIAKEQDMLNKSGELFRTGIEGRHDPCVLPRAVPIVEAMTALVIADHLLLNMKYVHKMT